MKVRPFLSAVFVCIAVATGASQALTAEGGIVAANKDQSNDAASLENSVVIFSRAQIDEGRRLFATNCTQCHTVEHVMLMANSRWSKRELGELFDVVRATMPPEGLARLSDQNYLDILSFALFAELGEAEVPTVLVNGGRWRQIKLQEGVANENKKLIDNIEKLQTIEWKNYRGSHLSQGYSPANIIDRNNVSDLVIAWRWTSQNIGPLPEMKNISTPLMIDGVLYFTAGITRNVVAVDAATGQTLWLWRPQENDRFDKAPRKGSGRGVAYWSTPDGLGRIFSITPGFRLVALDAKSGMPIPDFGENGSVDLKNGLRLPDDGEFDIGSSSPPLVIDGLVIVGPAFETGLRPRSKKNAKGDIRAFDALSGDLRWSFQTIPESPDTNNQSWLEGSARYTGNTGAWAPLSADPELGLVYVPVEAPTNDFYGGKRPGD